MSKLQVAAANSPLILDPALPEEPELRAVVEDVLAKFRYAYAAAAADERSAAPGSLDKLFRDFLATRSAPVRARARLKARTLLEATPAQRRKNFGRYAALSLKDYAAVGSDGVDERVGRLEVDPAALKKSFERLRTRISVMPPELPKPQRDGNGGVRNADLAAGLAFQKMRLYIRKVRCKDETSDGGDSDEINLGGVKVGATGNVELIDQFRVSHDFDKGETVDFGFSRKFCGWNIRTDTAGFPYIYTAVIVMAEKDDGGFEKMLKQLLKEIIKAIVNAALTLTGSAIGGILGGLLAGPVGLLVGMGIGLFIGWLFEDNADDLVAVHTVQMGLGACTKSYYDWARLTSAGGAPMTVVFKGDGGRYEVDLAYKVVTA